MKKAYWWFFCLSLLYSLNISAKDKVNEQVKGLTPVFLGESEGGFRYQLGKSEFNLKASEVTEYNDTIEFSPLGKSYARRNKLDYSPFKILDESNEDYILVERPNGEKVQIKRFSGPPESRSFIDGVQNNSIPTPTYSSLDKMRSTEESRIRKEIQRQDEEAKKEDQARTERMLNETQFNVFFKDIEKEYAKELPPGCLDYLKKQADPFVDNHDFFEDVLCKLGKKRAQNNIDDFQIEFNLESAIKKHKAISFGSPTQTGRNQFATDTIPIDTLNMIDALYSQTDKEKGFDDVMKDLLVDKGACLDPVAMEKEFKDKRKALLRAKNFYYGLAENHCLPILYTEGEDIMKVADYQGSQYKAGKFTKYPKASENKAASQCPNDRSDDFSGRGYNEKVLLDDSKPYKERFWAMMRTVWQDEIYEKHIVPKDQTKQVDWDAFWCRENSCYREKNNGKPAVPNDVTLDEYNGYIGKLTTGYGMNANFEYNQNFRVAARKGIVAMTDAMIKLSDTMSAAKGCLEGFRDAKANREELTKDASDLDSLSKQFKDTSPELSKKYASMAERTRQALTISEKTEGFPIFGDCIKLTTDLLDLLTEAVNTNAKGSALAKSLTDINKKVDSSIGKLSDEVDDSYGMLAVGKFVDKKRDLLISLTQHGNLTKTDIKAQLPNLEDVQDFAMSYMEEYAGKQLEELEEELKKSEQAAKSHTETSSLLADNLNKARLDAEKIDRALGALNSAWMSQNSLCNEIDIDQMKDRISFNRLTEKKCPVSIPKELVDAVNYYEVNPKLKSFPHYDVKLPPIE